MLDELYPQYLVDASETEPRFDLTLRISRDDIPKTLKAGKGKSEEEKQEIREKNEQIRAERQEICDKISMRFSKLRTDLLGSPFRKAIKDIKEGKDVTPCEIPFRPLEKYWIVSPAKGSLMVVFSMNFELADDQALARVMLLEF